MGTKRDTVHTLNFEKYDFLFSIEKRPEWNCRDYKDFSTYTGDRPKDGYAYVRTFAKF
jgi:hypothetical protein